METKIINTEKTLTASQTSYLFKWPGFNKHKSEWKSLSHIWLFATPWTVAFQAPLSMEFSRQEHWSGKTFLSSGDLPTQGSNPGPLHCRWILYQEPPGKPLISKVILQLQETNQIVECVERDSIQISLQIGLLYSFGKIVQQTTSSFQYCQRLPQWLKATIPNNILFLD